MKVERKISRFFSFVMLAFLFSLSLVVGTAKAEEIDFSKYTSTYGYDNLTTFEDGDDRQAVYNQIYDAYEEFWSSAQDLTTEYVAGSGFYDIVQIDISAYNLDTSDLLEIYMAFQFDNPILYYAPTTFYGPTENSQTMTLVVDANYITASERARLNKLVISKVSEYETAVASLTTDYDKMVAVHDKLLNSMYYSYDDEGNPSDEAWAHNVIGSFDKGKGVCESYAKVYQLVMNALGYESIMVAGTSNGEGHVWNLVKIDDKYYYVDCTWDDTLNGNSYSYFLKGSYEFGLDHTNYTTSGSGQTYQYALPNVCEDNYIKYLTVSCDGGAGISYGNVKLAFDSMTNANGSYVINVAKGYNLYLQGGEWPTVKEIRIVGYDHSDVNNVFYLDDIYIMDDANANSDIIIENMNFSTSKSFILDEGKLVTLDLGNNSITFSNVAYIGGYSFGDNAQEATASRTGVNVVGEDGSQFIVKEGITSSTVDTNLINVDEFILESGCRSLCDELYANKLILSKSSKLSVGSKNDDRPGAVVEFKETIVNDTFGYVESNKAYKDTEVSLGDVSGTGDLMVDITCVEEEAYPSINIDNSDVEIYFRLYNKIESGTFGSSGILENKTYQVWDDANNYNGGYLNVGSTDMDKIEKVLIHLYRSNNGEEPIETIYADNIALLCDIDENGNLYRKYNEKLYITGNRLNEFVYYDMDKCPTSVTIPSGVTTINSSAFLDCYRINSVIIPESVTTIHQQAFVGCGITEIVLPSTIFSEIGEYALGYTYDRETRTYNKVDGFKIYCYDKLPYAVTYAQNNGFEYELLPLPAINNLVASSRGNDNITLNWTADDVADGYIVSQKIDSVWVELADVTDASYKVTGLETVTNYYFLVEAYKINDRGERVFCNPKYIDVRTTPKKVTGLSITKRESNSITLTWNVNAEAVGYRVEQYIDGEWVEVGLTTHPETVEYKVTGLLAETNYQFRVAADAYDILGEYAYCETKTLPAAPEKVTGFKYGQVSPNSITLVWDESDDADGYVISILNDDGTHSVIKTITDKSTTSYKMESLESCVEYGCYIRAYVVDDLGDYVYSTYEIKYGYTLPTPITGLYLKDFTSNSITLGWDEYAYQDKISGIVIECWDSTNEEYKVVSYPGETACEQTFNYLESGTNYKYRVCVYTYEFSGRKLLSEYVYIEARTTVAAPNVVGGFGCGEKTNNSVTLSWNIDSYADGYEIEQYCDGEWINITTLSGEKSNYVVTGLSSMTRYSFRIRAYKNDGSKVLYSDYKVWVVDTLLDNVTNLVCSDITSESVTLKWNPVSGASGYRIEQYIDGSWVCVWNISGTMEDSVEITGLTPGTTYEFRVHAYNFSGNWIYSDYIYVNATTLLGTVTGFGYSGRTYNSITLKWDYNSYIDGYEIEQYKNGAWTTINTISGKSIISYKITGLSASKTYSFRIRAYKLNGSSKIYGPYLSNTIKTLPSAVSGFSYSGRTYNTVTLKWTKNTSADGYVIEQYKSGAWTTIATIDDETKVSHKVTGLNASVTNTFRIRTYKYDGSTKIYGAYAAKNVKTLPANTKGFTYSGRTVSTITLKWTKNTSAEGYVIEQYKSGAWTTIKTITSNGTVSHKVTGLSPNTSYQFRIKAYATDGSSKIYGSAATATISTKAIDISNCTISMKQTSFGYTGEYIKPVLTVTVKVDGKTVTLTNWKDYKVTYKNFKNPGVATITVSGRGITSGTKSITFQIRPSQVKNVKYAGKSTTYASIKWDKCVGVTGYEVYRATSKFGTYKKVGTVTTTTFKNTGLKSKTTYYYKVRAYKTVGATKIYGNYSAIYTIATK